MLTMILFLMLLGVCYLLFTVVKTAKAADPTTVAGTLLWRLMRK